MTAAIEYRSYAKLNLYLDVLNRRDDGYHNIETVYQTVDLSDVLYFSERRTRVSLTCESKDIETGEDNLIHRAAMLLRRACGCKMGVRVELEKHIPIAAGLAGGSGNAAAALIALNRLWNLGVAKEQLEAFALELGSDVPYCLSGGSAMATGRGEILTAIKPIRAAWFVLLHPRDSISTSRIFHHPDLPRKKGPPKESPTKALLEAVQCLEQGDFKNGVSNRFERVVFRDKPSLGRLKKRLLDAGCEAASMSGTGPTMYGICKTKKEAQAVATEFDDLPVTVAQKIAHGVERSG